MRHLRSLDGVRAIAVFMVMLFHFGYFAAGWIGVEIFFTLSGYLITSILLDAKEKSFGAFALNFYWHRTVRILPLLGFFIIGSAVCYFAFGEPSSLSSDWPWLISLTANFGRMRQSDLGPNFVHIWSLAVEQQFYLLWPVLLFFLPRHKFRLVVAALLVFTPIARLALFQGLTQFGFNEHYAGKAVYVLPFAQFDAFAAGAAIPLWQLERMRNAGLYFLLSTTLAAVGGFCVLLTEYFGLGANISSCGYSMFLLDGHGYVWGYSFLNLMSMFGIVCVIQRLGPVVLLETKLLAWMGKISFGIYVYHIPLLLLGRLLAGRIGVGTPGVDRLAFFVVWLAAVLLVSDISFRFLETPFLRLKNVWREP